MDHFLYKAAKRGDVKFLKERYVAGNYFFPEKIRSNKSRNLLHVASSKGRLEFVKEVLNRLPIQLVCQTDEKDDNPLHRAARRGHLDIVKLLVDAYRSSTSDKISDNNHPTNNLTDHHEWIIRAIESEGVVPSCPPWRAINHNDRTPVHVAAFSEHEQVVDFLLSQEPDFLSSVDGNSNSSSLLRDAVSGGCKSITNRILTSDVAYSTAKFDPYDIVTLATQCSENDAVLLLQQHPELVKCRYAMEPGPKRKTILHGAAAHNLVSVIRTVLNIDYTIANIVDDKDQNPLHIAVERGHYKIAKHLIYAFNKSSNNTGQQQSEIEEAVAEGSAGPPWRNEDIHRSTPLHLAAKLKYKEIARLILLSDLAFLCKMANEDKKHQPSLVMKVAKSVAADIRRSFMSIYLAAFRRFLAEKLKNKTDADWDAAKMLIKQYPELIRYTDVNGRTILQYLLDENNMEIMRFILKIDPSAIDIHKDQGKVEHLLFRACRKVNVPAVAVICEICPKVAQHLGREEKETALHHVGPGKTAEEYKKLLGIREIEDMKNVTDAKDRSPLMKAIQDNKLALAEALLTMKGIDILNVRNENEKTAADMLKNKANQSREWEKLYKKASANAISRIPLGTDFKELRSTLSIVAALLATITFAAAFTVPGGFDQNNGYVIFGKRTSFIVFILSDTYAMCCSMIVLYSLIWATFQEKDKALMTTSRSIKVLHHSLYGTMGAFMAAVYTMMSSKSIWVAFVSLLMCSSVVIFACMIINNKFVGRVVGTVNKEEDPENGEASFKRRDTIDIALEFSMLQFFLNLCKLLYRSIKRFLK